ncbi:hypothetical protein CVT26_003100 [Gymnopilus dilepis]|uniref:DUF6532 domain-containing protein n=1 Tax=Gymnopilus dilepis TaxID=231916 RepID=A0A409Y4Z3_9AGAR|nr:hypothetical protein CVT26_003100 [Gymnopilus dilepis]
MAKESQVVDNEDQSALKAYRRQNARLIRLAEREAEDRRLIAMSRDHSDLTRDRTDPRVSKEEALSGKLWLVAAKGQQQKRPSSPTSASKQSKPANGDVEEGDARDTKPTAHAKPSRKSTADSGSSSSSDSEDASGSGESEDDLPDPRSMTHEQIAQLLGGENPLIVQANKDIAAHDEEHAFPDLFSIRDEDVDMASLRSSSRASTRNSEPPLSEFAADSDGGEEVTGSNDAESEESETELPRHRPASSKQSKREEAFQKEQPKVVRSESQSKKTKTITSSSADKDSTKADEDDDSKWGPWARIVRNKRDKANLLDQHSTVRLVLYKAIKNAELDNLKKKAWPEQDTSREVYRREVLLAAAKQVIQGLDQDENEQRKRLEDIGRRVKGDSRFAAVLGDIVLDPWLSATLPALSSGFELGIGDSCTEKVQALLPDDLYIYPGRWETEQVDENTSKPVRVIDRTKIYQNLGFMDSLKEAFFESRRDFGFKYVNEFKSSIEKRPEPELTIPIVALAATGFFAAIQASESGKSREKAEKFKGELFNATFERHVSYSKASRRRT